jgi:chorismate mutase
MNEQQDLAAQERAEIAARVANFKATQEKFRREREEYFVITLENACHSLSARHSGRRRPLKRSQSQYKKPGSDAPGFSITNTGDYQ